MPKGPQGEIRPAEVVGYAVHIAQISTGEMEETPSKQPDKRNNDLAGGKPRLENTTDVQRSEIARKAAHARWE